MKRHTLIHLFIFMQQKSGIIRFGRGRFEWHRHSNVSLFSNLYKLGNALQSKGGHILFWVLLQFESFHGRKNIYFALFQIVIHSEGKTLGKLPKLVWYQLILIPAGTTIGTVLQKNSQYQYQTVLAILKVFDTSLVLVFGSILILGYMAGICLEYRLV